MKKEFKKYCEENNIRYSYAHFRPNIDFCVTVFNNSDAIILKLKFGLL